MDDTLNGTIFDFHFNDTDTSFDFYFNDTIWPFSTICTFPTWSFDFYMEELDNTLVTSVSAINLILGLPINSYVLWLILSGAGGTIASEFFYLNLIVSVMMTSSLESVFGLARVFTCKWNFLTVRNIALGFSLFSVPWFQCCICGERYIAVVHPVLFLRYKHLRYRVACCCVVWLMVFAFILGSFFWVSQRTVRMLVSLSILLGLYIVCISLVSFCCLSVLRALKQPGPGEGQRDSGEGNNMKRRAFKIILISLIVMLLTTVSCILHAMSNPILHNTLFYDEAYINITYTIVMMLWFVYPLLYIHKAGKLPCC